MRVGHIMGSKAKKKGQQKKNVQQRKNAQQGKKVPQKKNIQQKENLGQKKNVQQKDNAQPKRGMRKDILVAVILVVVLILSIVAFFAVKKSKEEKALIRSKAADIESTIKTFYGDADITVEGKSVIIENPRFRENELMTSICFYNYYYTYICPEQIHLYEDYTIEEFYANLEKYVGRTDSVLDWCDAFDFDFCDPRNLQQSMQGFSLYREMVSDITDRLSVDYEDATTNQVLEAYKAFEKELAKDLE